MAHESMTLSHLFCHHFARNVYCHICVFVRGDRDVGCRALRCRLPCITMSVAVHYDVSVFDMMRVEMVVWLVCRCMSGKRIWVGWLGPQPEPNPYFLSAPPCDGMLPFHARGSVLRPHRFSGECSCVSG